MSIVQSPRDTQKITPQALVDILQQGINDGKVEHLIICIMGSDTAVNCAVTTSGAMQVVYMQNQLRLQIEALMRANGLLP